MADEDAPQDAEIDEVSARLNDALKSCRSVIANYKALLAAEQKSPEADEEPGSVADQLGDPPA
ncbi:MAG TPA: hypothetical protein VFW39_05040 [Sphingomicrobium sp.]|nr:hypothetical protein [Sphingomicrobium sp.]